MKHFGDFKIKNVLWLLTVTKQQMMTLKVAVGDAWDSKNVFLLNFAKSLLILLNKASSRSWHHLRVISLYTVCGSSDIQNRQFILWQTLDLRQSIDFRKQFGSIDAVDNVESENVNFTECAEFYRLWTLRIRWSWRGRFAGLFESPCECPGQLRGRAAVPRRRWRDPAAAGWSCCGRITKITPTNNSKQQPTATCNNDQVWFFKLYIFC